MIIWFHQQFCSYSEIRFRQLLTGVSVDEGAPLQNASFKEIVARLQAATSANEVRWVKHPSARNLFTELKETINEDTAWVKCLKRIINAVAALFCFESPFYDMQKAEQLCRSFLLTFNLTDKLARLATEGKREELAMAWPPYLGPYQPRPQERVWVELKFNVKALIKESFLWKDDDPRLDILDALAYRVENNTLDNFKSAILAELLTPQNRENAAALLRREKQGAPIVSLIYWCYSYHIHADEDKKRMLESLVDIKQLVLDYQQGLQTSPNKLLDNIIHNEEFRKYTGLELHFEMQYMERRMMRLGGNNRGGEEQLEDEMAL